MTVDALKTFARLALLSDGSTVPVTNLYDADGNETDDPNEAATFVAGEGDKWFSGAVSDFAEVATH